LNGTLPVKCLVIMIIRATQKKMMSWPVTSTLLGRNRSCSMVWAGQPRVEKGTRAAAVPGVQHVGVAGQRAAVAGGVALARASLRCGDEQLAAVPYQAGIWWPHHSWRLMHQSWMFFIHWL
jgi:hypothetical protein